MDDVAFKMFGILCVGIILTWFCLLLISKQIKKNYAMLLAGELATAKLMDKYYKDISIQVKVNTINELIATLELNTYEDDDFYKVKLIRDTMKEILNANEVKE
jgi:hypothetical protein